MDVEPTAEQLMLRDSTRAFLESRSSPERIRELAAEANGFDQDLWKRGASLGWTAMLVPEGYGGTGLGSHGIIGAAILAEEFGRMLYSGPLLQLSVVADAVVRVGSDAQKEAILSNLVSGSSIATWAIADGPGGWDARGIGVTAYREGDGYVLRGVKRWVQDAHVATQLLVTCRDNDGVVQLLVPCDAPGLAKTNLVTADLGRRLSELEFRDVYVPYDCVLGDSTGAAAQVARQLSLAVVVQCAESVGATARVVERTVSYAHDRVAFGRPIGSFQAVKHLLAHAATWLEAAEAATWAAARAFSDERPDLEFAAHVAKAFVARHCPRIVENCMQVLGGIAMTWEDPSHFYLRRVRSNAVLFGSAAWHADRLCDLLGMAA